MAGSAGSWYKTGSGSVNGRQFVSRATLTSLGLNPSQVRAGLSLGDPRMIARINAAASTPAGAAKTKATPEPAPVTRSVDSVLAAARTANPGLTITKDTTAGSPYTYVKSDNFQSTVSSAEKYQGAENLTREDAILIMGLESGKYPTGDVIMPPRRATAKRKPK